MTSRQFKSQPDVTDREKMRKKAILIMIMKRRVRVMSNSQFVFPSTQNKRCDEKINITNGVDMTRLRAGQTMRTDFRFSQQCFGNLGMKGRREVWEKL